MPRLRVETGENVHGVVAAMQTTDVEVRLQTVLSLQRASSTRLEAFAAAGGLRALRIYLQDIHTKPSALLLPVLLLLARIPVSVAMLVDSKIGRVVKPLCVSVLLNDTDTTRRAALHLVAVWRAVAESSSESTTLQQNHTLQTAERNSLQTAERNSLQSAERNSLQSAERNSLQIQHTPTIAPLRTKSTAIARTPSIDIFDVLKKTAGPRTIATAVSATKRKIGELEAIDTTNTKHNAVKLKLETGLANSPHQLQQGSRADLQRESSYNNDIKVESRYNTDTQKESRYNTDIQVESSENTDTQIESSYNTDIQKESSYNTDIQVEPSDNTDTQIESSSDIPFFTHDIDATLPKISNSTYLGTEETRRSNLQSRIAIINQNDNETHQIYNGNPLAGYDPGTEEAKGLNRIQNHNVPIKIAPVNDPKTSRFAAQNQSTPADQHEIDPKSYREVVQLLKQKTKKKVSWKSGPDLVSIRYIESNSKQEEVNTSVSSWQELNDASSGHNNNVFTVLTV